MASVNKVILIGNLGQDPELRYTQTGNPVTTLRIATTDRFSGRDGTTQERTEWHNVVVWGKQAENCTRYLSKGRSIFVEGSLQTREWEDREGNKRTTTEVRAWRVQFLGGPREGSGRGGAPRDLPPPPEGGGSGDAGDAPPDSDPPF